MATSVNISWTPATGSLCISQLIEYKKSISSTWVEYSTVSVTTHTATITGLDDNTSYDFRILSNCNFGGPSPSTPFSIINIVCPTVTFTSSTTSIGYSFTNPHGSINNIIVQLYDTTGVHLITSQTPSLSSDPVTGSFTSLTIGADYQINLVIQQIISSVVVFTKTCDKVPVSTTVPCDGPTDLVASFTP